MFEILKAILLGIIEGITEFLPISSTGHLILANQFLSFDKPFENLFDVVIQFGAILSVLVYFRKKLIPFGQSVSVLDRKNIFELWKKAIVGVIPAIIIGALFGDLIDTYLFNPIVVSVSLFIGGIIIIYIESKNRRTHYKTIESLSYKTVLLIGLIQCLAVIPGTSRSACTIIGAMLLGASRVVAAEFSFFLAIPTMVCASGYTLLKSGMHMTGTEAMILLTGMITSFFVAYLVIAAFMKLIKQIGFKPFGYYRIVLGAIVLIYFLKP